MTKNNNGNGNKEDSLGIRFNIFRRLVGKSMIEFSSESSLSLRRIKGIEQGRNKNPGISDFEYFCESYGLNLTWLLMGEGRIFYKNGYKTPMYASLTDIVIEYGPNAYDKFLAIIGDISKSQDQKEREVTALYNKILEKMRQV